MTDTTIPVRDAALATHNRRMLDEGAAGKTPYNAEHPDPTARPGRSGAPATEEDHA